MLAKEYTSPMERKSSSKRKAPMKREKNIYVRPEIEMIEIKLTHLLANSHEINVDSEHQGDEEADFTKKRDNSRGEWGNLWGD